MGYHGDKRLWTLVKRERRQVRALRNKERWYCAACQREHSIRVARVEKLDGQVICFRRLK